MNKPLKVKCPTCQKESAWNPSNPYRPFCCERCKLIDLGAWAGEQHAIPGEPDFSQQEEENGDHSLH